MLRGIVVAVAPVLLARVNQRSVALNEHIYVQILLPQEEYYFWNMSVSGILSLCIDRCKELAERRNLFAEDGAVLS